MYKRILFFLTSVLCLIHFMRATEVRGVVVEPYPYYNYWDTLYIGDTFYLTHTFYGGICFKFYDTLYGYTDCPCAPDDTVTGMHWSISDATFPWDTIVPKGTAVYRCFDADEGFIWQASALNGTYIVQRSDALFWVHYHYLESAFSLKEIQSSCGHKKVQLQDSTRYIPIRFPDSYWIMQIRDSSGVVVQLDSGREVAPYTDSSGCIVERERPSPVFELNEPGLYTFSFIVYQFDAGQFSDTSIQYVRVNDCTTGIPQYSDPPPFSVQVINSQLLQLHIDPDVGWRDAQVMLYATDGRLVRSTSVTGDTFQWNTGNLPSGIYLLKVLDNALHNYQTKLIIY